MFSLFIVIGVNDLDIVNNRRLFNWKRWKTRINADERPSFSYL